MDIHWLKNKFVPVYELFPYWIMAEVMLTEFVGRTGDWLLVTDNSQLDYGLEFPLVKDEISGQMVPMFAIFPPEDRPKVAKICLAVMADYFGPTEKYINEMITDSLTHQMVNQAKARESYIVSCGGRSVKDELRFRLGVTAERGLYSTSPPLNFS